MAEEVLEAAVVDSTIITVAEDLAEEEVVAVDSIYTMAEEVLEAAVVDSMIITVAEEVDTEVVAVGSIHTMVEEAVDMEMEEDLMITMEEEVLEVAVTVVAMVVAMVVAVEVEVDSTHLLASEAVATVEVEVVDTVPEVVMTRTRAAAMAAVVSRATTRKNKNERISRFQSLTDFRDRGDRAYSAFPHHAIVKCHDHDPSASKQGRIARSSIIDTESFARLLEDRLIVQILHDVLVTFQCLLACVSQLRRIYLIVLFVAVIVYIIRCVNTPLSTVIFNKLFCICVL
ncbi:unnamed protein product [Heterotrigona itama]|uniref:Uncharacterized protein n=1 Tax=Heterotrigona itama TaxID=395501 RepID=A0A6V7GWW6_9HYME|nr:unnamed protein product [Heterotrigona itama]